MVFPALIGVALLLLVIYAAFKVLKGIISGLILLALGVFAFYLIYGSLPQIPFLPRIPALGDLIGFIIGFFYKLEIVSISRDAANNLLITVRNGGRLSLSGFQVLVNEKVVEIINEPTDPLPSGQSTVLQVDWKAEFERIEVRTGQTSVVYEV